MQGITDVITLNVSGTLFHSTRATLSKSPFLEALIKTVPDDNGRFPFIDRDAKGFRHVLSLLRDPTYPFPRRLNHELAFYGLDCPSHAPHRGECEEYALLSSLNPGQPVEGPVQLVRMHEPMMITSCHAKNRTDVAIHCKVSAELQRELARHACKFMAGTSAAVECVSDTHVFMQVGGELKLMDSDMLLDVWRDRAKNNVCLGVVPVLKNLTSAACAAIVIVSSIHCHKFQ
jgi:hypothetical protein